MRMAPFRLKMPLNTKEMCFLINYIGIYNLTAAL